MMPIINSVKYVDETPQANAPLPEPVVQKKKRGRPKKVMMRNIPDEICGVAAAPQNPEHHLEMVYCNPTVLKKLFGLHKAYGVQELEICFDSKQMTFMSTDHLKKSTICVTIDCNLINHYFCRSKITIIVSQDMLDKILCSIDNNQYKVTFVIKNDYKSSLYIIIKDNEYSKDNTYEVEVPYDESNARTTFPRNDDSNYPLKFTFSGKHLKNEINKFYKMCKVLTIQKVREDPLQITYTDAKKIQYTGSYNVAEKIALQSTLTDEDVFSVSIPIDYIRSFSNSSIGEQVQICADWTRPISFTTTVDQGAIVIKVYTNILHA